MSVTRRLADADPERRGRPIQLSLEGRPVRAYSGESVATALYASGHRVLSRSLKYHRPRAFFCLEGHCGGCLMRIDGVPNIRSCMEPARDGLRVEAQNAYPAADLDVLEAVDWLFPRGMDHHTLMTGSRIVNAVVNRVVRQLSGLGQLPDGPADELPPVRTAEPDVVVVGGGPAGLAAARESAALGARTLLVDEHPTPGGSLLADPRHGPAEAEKQARAAIRAGAELRPGCAAIAYFGEGPDPVLAVATPEGLLLVRARRTVYATGGYAINRLFGNNDRPGVVAARAVGRLVVRDRVAPGHRVCVVAPGPEDPASQHVAAHAAALMAALREVGCEVFAVEPPADTLIGARGRSWVEAVEVRDRAGETRVQPCDLVAVAATPAPASEAARQHGCRVELRPHLGGFAVLTDERGQTSVTGVYAGGDVCGYQGPERASATGARAGRAAAASLSGAAPGAPGGAPGGEPAP